MGPQSRERYPRHREKSRDTCITEVGIRTGQRGREFYKGAIAPPELQVRGQGVRLDIYSIVAVVCAGTERPRDHGSGDSHGS